MTHILEPGQTVRCELSGTACKIVKYLGGGGQGEVYEADQNGREVAIKWYFSKTATDEQRNIIERLVEVGSPNASFLWPEELVESNSGGFGYLMPLRPAAYTGVHELIRRRVEPSFRILALVGKNLADSFLQLHAKGLCYRDISHGNVFFDPDTGDVLICDNDNVTFDGEGADTVLGTPKFMAPEIVTGKARPSTETDLFSLAVLLFIMFMLHHPLDGAKEAAIHSFDRPAMDKLYGFEPLFIFDPDDRSNRPVPPYQRNAVEFWPIYPQFLRDLFTRSFTDGLHDPENGRVRESEWRSAMARLHDLVVFCPACGAENFVEDEPPGAGNPKTWQDRACWHCDAPVPIPLMLRVRGHYLALTRDSKMFPHHTDADRLYDFSTPVGEVAEHPSRPGIWGLRNLSEEKWVATGSDGAMVDVSPGRALTLSRGIHISFGNLDAELV